MWSGTLPEVLYFTHEVSFFFFSFAAGSPIWLYRQGTFLAQMVGYRRKFKNGVENLGGDPPVKYGGPKPPNVENQSRSMRSKLIVGIGPENEYPKLVSKFWGLPPKKFEGGQSVEISILKLALLRGHASLSLHIFTSGSGSWCITYVPLGGGAPPPQKNLGGQIFSQLLRVKGMVQNFSGNSPVKKYPKLVSKFWGLPPKKLWGGQN